MGVEGDGGNDDVDVGMVLDLASPGVEDGGEVEDEAIVFEFGAGDVAEGLGTGFEEEAVEDFWLMKAEGAELFWYRKSDHEVRDSQESGFLFDGPLLLVSCSALGAVTVVTAVVGVVFFSAGGVGALVEAAAELGGPARENAPDGLIMDAVYLVAIGLDVWSPVLAQDICEGECHFGFGLWKVALFGLW